MMLEFFHRLTLISIQHFKKKLERMKFVTALKMWKETVLKVTMTSKWLHSIQMNIKVEKILI